MEWSYTYYKNLTQQVIEIAYQEVIVYKSPQNARHKHLCI